ncbi:hypothetical protein H6F94_00990 [Leptolyngbya sp. FACHB-261]|nr:hypothetical protein [Leptolyngbya sp. FACHB-261]
MKRRLMTSVSVLALAVGIGGVEWRATSPAQAQACTALAVVGGRGTQVRKTVSPAGTLVTGNNWNTDFAVPNGNRFRRYTVTILPENDGQYNIQMYLKYSNDTSDQFYNQNNVRLTRGRRFYVSGQPRDNSNQPYQVNVYVGGTVALGNTYTASVVGCR